MTAEAFAKGLPRVVTLNHVAALNAGDRYGHRYELSPEGALFVMPPADSEHAVIATRLLLWFAYAGWPAEQLMQAVGIRVSGPLGDGGRIPDLTVWSKSQERAVWLPVADLRLVIEIVSHGSELTDQIAKVAEYAASGIPQYWTVARDAAQTVTLHRLGSDGKYEVTAKMPLAWLLKTAPAEHQIG